jgi:hypothetical protein
MATLSLANVITVTLLSALSGIANANTSILALITHEAPVDSGYGDYGIYYDSASVSTDFGSNSVTYELAELIFSQSPNILSGGGYLVIIPLNQSASATAATILGDSAVDLTKLTATDYHIKAAVDGGSATEITIGELDLTSLETAESSLNAYALETAGLVFSLTGELGAASVTLSSLTTGASSAITLSDSASGTDIAKKLGISEKTATGAAAGVERVKDAILRTYGSIDYFGVILSEKQTDANLLEIAATMQTLDKMLVVGSNLSADFTSDTGVFTKITSKSYTHTRCLYHSVSADDALQFAAGYSGRGFCINFDGTNTVHTMHLKDITGLAEDTGLTQTLLTKAKNNGVDCYASLGSAGGSVQKVFTSGANGWFDYIYTSLAFKLRIITAGFNALATTNTKLPQTEEGMNSLKKAYREVCTQFVSNGAFAPGTWNNSTTFGKPEDHIRNISDVGYFVYSDPIASQSQAVRETRKAPSVYIAAKASGAIHSSDVTVYIEQ